MIDSFIWLNTGSNDLNEGLNWSASAVPDEFAQMVFASTTFVPSTLWLTGAMNVDGILVEAGAGALTIGSDGTSARTLSIGLGGITNASSSQLSFGPTSQVALVLSESASFWADGAIAITDAANSTSGVNLLGFTLTLDGASTGSSIAKGITGTGNLVKSGAGTWTLSGLNSYTGSTTLQEGKLSVSLLANGGVASGIGQSSAAAANLVFAGGTLQYTGPAATTNRLFTLSSTGGAIEASGSGALVFGASGNIAFSAANLSPTLVLRGDNTAGNTFAPVLGNSGSGVTSLTKSDTGKWVLAGANTLTGTVAVTGGTLSVGAGAALGGSAVSVSLSGGVLELNHLTQTVASLAASAGTLQLGAGHTLTVNQAGTTTFAGVVAGSGSLTKSGVGALNFAGVNSFTGTLTLLGGTVTVDAGATIAGASAAVVINGGLLNVEGMSDSIATLTLLTGELGGQGKLKLLGTGSAWTGGALSGTGTLTIENGADLTVSGAVEHNFSTREIVNRGTLNWTAGDLRSSTGGSVRNAGTFNDTTTGTSTQRGSGTFTNEAGASYEKSGAGATTIETPFVNSGQVRITSGSITFSGSFTNSGGSLTGTAGNLVFTSPLNLGTGTLSGDITVTASTVTTGGPVRPGVFTGTLTVTGNLTLLGTSSLLIELGGASQGITYDFLSASGTVTLGGTLSADFVSGFGGSVQGGDVFVVVSGGSLNGAFANVASGQRLFTMDGAGSFVVNYGVGSAFGANQVVFSNYVAVPEPAAWHLLLAGAAVGFWLRQRDARRRRGA